MMKSMVLKRGAAYTKAFKKLFLELLGTFDSFEDAVAARKAAEEKYFGDYSYDNSMAASPVIEVA